MPQFRRNEKKHIIWIHAVSVGEVIASKALIEHLLRKDVRIALSVTTKTGFETAKKSFNDSVYLFYFPLDFHAVTDKVAEFINPSVFLLMETEIWPNLIMSLAAKKVPIILVNGRISDKSVNGYRLIRPALKKILSNITLFLMQSDVDAERIKSLGAPAEKIRTTGSIKFDAVQGLRIGDKGFPAFGGIPFQRESFSKESLGIKENEDLIICGSTHDGEEEILLEIYEGLLKKLPDLHILIAPRHIDRVENIEKLCTEFGFDSLRLSKITSSCNPYSLILNPSNKPILILDTIGQLAQLYSLATIVFMGGSMVKKGGHNIVEPAKFSKPIIFGPYMNNFRAMSRMFLNADAALVVRDKDELKNKIAYVMENSDYREKIGKKAHSIIEKNRGALNKVVNEIEEFLK